MKIFQKRPVAAVIMVLAILVGFSMGCSRKPEGGAEPNGAFAYVLHNEDGALSQATVTYVEDMNESLFSQTGAQVVVDVVGTTGSQDIADYAEEVFVHYGIGSRERDNGVLLVLALRNLYNGAPDGDYYIAWGSGFSASQQERLENALLDNLEAGFAAKQYDSALRRTFDALIDELEGFYGVTVQPGVTGGAAGGYHAGSGSDYDPGEPAPAFLMGNIIGMLILLLVLWMILDAFRYRRYRRRYIQPGFPPPPRYYPVFWGRPRRPRRPPPPPPPGGGRPSGGFRSGGSFGGGAGRARPSGGAKRSSRPSGGARRSPGGGGRRR